MSFTENKELFAWGRGVLQSRAVLHHLLKLRTGICSSSTCTLFPYASHPHHRSIFPDLAPVPQTPLPEERFFEGAMLEMRGIGGL